MTDTLLGDRMKRYEDATRAVLPARTYSVLRVDGRAFHTYLRAARRPFDDEFMAAMDAVGQALCTEIQGAVLAYTQSDEVSVLFTDFGAPGTQPWFGGVVAKQVSIAAAIATATFNAQHHQGGRTALFDARVFTISSPVEVANYLVWRQRDAVRNSISMTARAHFSHRRLHGLNSGRMQELLWQEAGINWSDYPDGAKRGRITTRHTGPRETQFTDRRTGTQQTVTATRSWWETEPAPHLTALPDGWLAGTIPALPTLATTAGAA